MSDIIMRGFDVQQKCGTMVDDNLCLCASLCKAVRDALAQEEESAATAAMEQTATLDDVGWVTSVSEQNFLKTLEDFHMLRKTEGQQLLLEVKVTAHLLTSWAGEANAGDKLAVWLAGAMVDQNKTSLLLALFEEARLQLISLPARVVEIIKTKAEKSAHADIPSLWGQEVGRLLQEACSSWLHLQFFDQYRQRLLNETANLLSGQGYDSLEELRKSKTTRCEWTEFAARIGVPEAIAINLAAHWGPKLPSANVVMDRRERLAAELRAYFGGDWDSAYTFCDTRKYEPVHFLMHDTWASSAQAICRDGVLKSNLANDSAYDSHLVFGQAPQVVFFQASKTGTDGSIYPREQRFEAKEDKADQASKTATGGSIYPREQRSEDKVADKARFLLPPKQLALQAPSIRMYFVSISEAREAKHRGQDEGMLQLHVLFISEHHKALAFCEEHFLLVNKKTFQPFKYDFTREMWKSIGTKKDDLIKDKGKGELPFLGRQVKINVCVAQDVPISFTMASTNPLSADHSKYLFVKEYGGILQAPGGFKNASGRVGVGQLCNKWVEPGTCAKNSCHYQHPCLISSIPRLWAQDCEAEPGPSNYVQGFRATSEHVAVDA